MQTDTHSHMELSLMRRPLDSQDRASVLHCSWSASNFCLPIDTINHLNHSGYENHKMSSHSFMRLSLFSSLSLSLSLFFLFRACLSIQLSICSMAFFRSIRSSLSRETFSVYPLHCIVAVCILFISFLSLLFDFFYPVMCSTVRYTVAVASQCYVYTCMQRLFACTHRVFGFCFLCSRRRRRHHHHFDIYSILFYLLVCDSRKYSVNMVTFFLKSAYDMTWLRFSIWFSCKALQFNKKKRTYLNHGL